MNKIENQFTSIQQVTDRYLNANSSSAAKGTSDVSFEEILKRKQDVSEAFELKFSKHAAMRLEDRNINLSRKQSERLQKASEKGIQESLVMVDSLAFIVNVPNKTVVTAMDQGETEKNVFTNIDGAVIA